MNWNKESILITGGTGSLGKTLLHRFTSMASPPRSIRIFSRDEAKQFFLRQQYSQDYIDWQIGDIRDDKSVAFALKNIDIVINAAALKQVPNCEDFPLEAIKTNILGADNIVSCIAKQNLPIKIVLGVSTDKAAMPINVMGMTKALQEKVFIKGNHICNNTKLLCVRYGNVLASRGSVIPFFHELILQNKPIPITHSEMTRFLMSLEDAVDLIFDAIEFGYPGETWIPKIRAARILDIVNVLVENNDTSSSITITDIRPGEKLHESLISEDEMRRTIDYKNRYIIRPIIKVGKYRSRSKICDIREYRSNTILMDKVEIKEYLLSKKLLIAKNFNI